MLRALSFALFCVAVAAPADAAEKSDRQVARELKLCAPATYEAAIVCLDRFLPADVQARLAAPDGAIEAHFGLGMWLRNNWGLWSGSKLSRSMQALGFEHPDNMSGAILEGFTARERGEPFDVTTKAAEYREEGQRLWDQAKREGRAGSIECPKGPEPKNEKEAMAHMEACLDFISKSLESDPR